MLRNRGFKKKWHANFSSVYRSGKSMAFATAALFFSFVAVASILPSGALAEADTNSIATADLVPEIIAQPPVPLVVLNQTEGNFFVLASDIPFEIRPAEPAVSWLAVEPLTGLQTAPRIVQLASNAENLPSGNYFSAVRVSLKTSAGEDYLLIPVALNVGPELKGDFSQIAALQKRAPENTMRFYVQDSNIDVGFTMTPGGHYVFEIINIKKRKRKLQQLKD